MPAPGPSSRPGRPPARCSGRRRAGPPRPGPTGPATRPPRRPRDGGGRPVGAGLPQAPGDRGGVVPLGCPGGRVVAHGEAQEAGVVGEERHGADTEVVGHQLQGRPEEVGGQGDGVADRQHGHAVERPDLVDQLGPVGGHQARAPGLRGTGPATRPTARPPRHGSRPTGATTRPSSGGPRTPAGRRGPRAGAYRLEGRVRSYRGCHGGERYSAAATYARGGQPRPGRTSAAMASPFPHAEAAVLVARTGARRARSGSSWTGAIPSVA